MDEEAIRDYCLAKAGVTEDFPFDEDTLVFRVGEKIFLLMGLGEEDPFVNLKCDPARAVELRGTYDAVRPGYHMSKKHWNSVYLRGSFTAAELREWIDHSYELVSKKLRKADRVALGLE